MKIIRLTPPSSRKATQVQQPKLLEKLLATVVDGRQQFSKNNPLYAWPGLLPIA